VPFYAVRELIRSIDPWVVIYRRDVSRSSLNLHQRKEDRHKKVKEKTKFAITPRTLGKEQLDILLR
jgi:hypothetical protein